VAGYEVREIVPTSAASVTDGGQTETAVLASGQVSTPGPNATLVLSGVVNITPGTAATAIVVNIREGNGTTGAVVYTTTDTNVIAATAQTIPFFAEFDPGDVADEVYTVTVAETSASADGTVNYASIGGFIN